MLGKLLKAISIILTVGVSFIFMHPLANAADFPNKPIKIIITTEPGGGEDMDARAVAPYLQKHLGVKVFLENQPGAGGKIAFEKFQKTKPDGYTITIYNFPKSIISEYMGRVNFRTKEFTPLYGWYRSSQVLAAHVDDWKDFKEFLNAAKTKALSGGTMGRGSISHLSGVVAIEKFGIKVNWVPYEGSGAAVAALAGKHLDFLNTLPSSCKPLIDAGKIRPLIILSELRDPLLPDVPIPKDLGYDFTGFLHSTRVAMAPPNTPSAIVNVLEAAFRKSINEPGYIEWARRRLIIPHPTISAKELSEGMSGAYSTIEQFKHLLVSP